MVLYRLGFLQTLAAQPNPLPPVAPAVQNAAPTCSAHWNGREFAFRPANGGNTLPLFWRYTVPPSSQSSSENNAALAVTLREIRERLHSPECGDSHSELLAAYSHFLEQSDLSNLSVQQELHHILPSLLETLQTPGPLNSTSTNALRVLHWALSNSGDERDFRRMLSFRIAGYAGAHFPSPHGGAIQQALLHLLAGDTSSSTGVNPLERQRVGESLRNLIFAEGAPENIRALCLLLWAEAPPEPFSETQRSAILRRLESWSQERERPFLIRSLAFQNFLRLQPPPPRGVLDQHRIESLALRFIEEARGRPLEWEAFIHDFSQLFGQDWFNHRITLNFCVFLNFVAENAQAPFRVRQQALLFYERIPHDSEVFQSSPLGLTVLSNAFRILRPLLSNVRLPTEDRLLRLHTYSLLMQHFWSTLNLMGETDDGPFSALFFAEVRALSREVRTMLSSPATPADLAEMALREVYHFRAAFDRETARQLLEWSREVLSLRHLPQSAQLLVLGQMIALEGILTRPDDPSLDGWIENAISERLQHADSPENQDTSIYVYDQFLRAYRQRRYPHENENFRFFAALTQNPNTPESTLLQILPALETFSVRHGPASPTAHESLNILQRLLRDTRASDNLREVALTRGVGIIRGFPANSPERQAWIRTLNDLSNDASPHFRGEVQFTLERVYGQTAAPTP
ncbi:MAG: hypothetical protein U1F57_05905 [bacterium]